MTAGVPLNLDFDGLIALKQHRDRRTATGLALIEGARFVGRAQEHGVPVCTIAVAPKLMSIGTRRVWHRLAGRVPEVRLTTAEFRSLSLLAAPSGLAAVIRQRWQQLPQTAPRRPRVWLAVQWLRSPGNFGSILRTCEAVGAAGTILLGDAMDPYDPRVIRASMGSVFAQRLVRATPADLRRFKRTTAATVVGAAPSAARDYRRGSYRAPLVLMLGSERKGLSSTQRRLCDQIVRIPMAGATDSLNVAVAASLLLYESYRQQWPLGS